MFFQVKKDNDVTRVLRASRFDDLLSKATQHYKLNPSTAVLTY